MEEEEDEDDIYAPDDSIPGLSTPAPNSGADSAIPPKANDELEEGEEEDEEMEEDYGESDSVGVFFLLSYLYHTNNTIKTRPILLSQKFQQQLNVRGPDRIVDISRL